MFHPSSLGCYLLPMIHPQPLRHHIISSQLSPLIPVTYYPSTTSTSSYHLIPALSTDSDYLLSIHNLRTIIPFHRSSLGCFLLLITLPQSLRHHIISSEFFQLIPVIYYPSIITTSTYHLIPVLSAAYVTKYPPTISTKSYHRIPVPSAASCCRSSIHNLHVPISSYSSSGKIIQPPSQRHDSISSQFRRLQPFI